MDHAAKSEATSLTGAPSNYFEDATHDQQAGSPRRSKALKVLHSRQYLVGKQFH